VALELVLLAALAGIAVIGLPKLWQAERTPTALWIAGWASASSAGVLQLLDGQLGVLDVLALPLGTLFPCLVLAGARLLVGRPATRALLALALGLGAARVALFLAYGQVASQGLALAIEPALVVTAAATVRGFRPGGRLLAASFVLLAIAGVAHLLWFAGGRPVSLPIVAVWLAATPPLLALQLEAGAAWARRELEQARHELEARVEARTLELARVNASLRAEIAEHRTTEAERRRLALRVQEAQRLESLAVLAGGVAHDFNNLLSVITGYSELLLTRIDGRNPARREIEEIHKAGERAAALTQQLLAYSRRQVLKPRMLCIGDVVENLGKMLRRLIGEDIHFATESQEDLWTVRADPSQIEQILMNLCINARDAMPAGGKLVVSTANVTLEAPHVERDLTIPPGRYATLQVADDGSGIDEEILSRIFEPFFTTKDQGKGTGLGLATVYGIVKQSDGYIRVISAPGNGTTFSVYLPAAEREEPEPEEYRPETGCEGPAGKWTILLAEDEEMVRELAIEIFREAGYTVLDAQNGAAALAICDRHAGSIDLLVTDLVMPGMNGIELARRVCDSRPGTPVLFMSGYAEDAMERLGVLDDGRDFLQKPITPTNLSRKVREIFSERAGGDPGMTPPGGRGVTAEPAGAPGA